MCNFGVAPAFRGIAAARLSRLVGRFPGREAQGSTGMFLCPDSLPIKCAGVVTEMGSGFDGPMLDPGLVIFNLRRDTMWGGNVDL